MMDVDFLLLSEDEGHLLDAVPALEEAGFHRRFRYRNNRGTVTEYTFARHEASFDFFLFFPDAQPGVRRYFSYYYTPDDLLELEGELVEQPLEQFRFLDRSWLKPKDHEAYLDAIYGDWKTPQPDWSPLSDGALVDRRPWNATSYAWD
jgi:hypothetical protein